MKISGFYARVSTSRQEKEETIDSQIAEIEQKAKVDENIIGENLRFIDEGWSGELLARPALDTLRDAIKNKQLEILYVYDLGRLSRTFLNQLILIEEIKNSGIELISLHDINAETQEQVLAQRVMGIFHDYERVKIAERMRRGKIFKAKAGKYMNLSAPYGYSYIPKTNDSEPRLLVNEEEAEVVRKIFHWIADKGFTIRGVIRKLHESKIYPRKKKRLVWSNSPICRMLRNEAYIGMAYYNKSIATVPENPKINGQYKRIRKSSRKRRPKEEWLPIQIPAILEEELFNRVQQQLLLNQKYNKRNRKAPYLLTGLIYCVCGRRRIGEGVREHRYYRCTDRISRFPLPRECTASGVNAFYLDDKLWEKVSKLLGNPALIKGEAEKWMERHKKLHNSSQTNKEKLHSILKKLKEEEKRYLKLYGAGLVNFEEVKDELKDIRGRKENIDIEIKRVHETQIEPVFDLTNVKNLTHKVTKVIQSLKLDEKRKLLQQLLESVTVGNSNKVLVKGYIPLERYAQNVKFWPISRNRGITERWKVDVV